jgi:hypothetical protein
MSIYIFTGPTISEEECIVWLEDAVYLPPVSQGDIISLLKKKPVVIGIIDGYFDTVPAVWHKEILLAVSKGVIVVGGASMGALRAAELHSFGMVGIGEIFRWYRDGIIDADDEVAVHHSTGEFHFKAFNESLVNIRKTLQMAVAIGVIDSETEKKLVEIGRNLDFWNRNYPLIFSEGKSAGILVEEIQRIETYVEKNRIDLKKLDAIELLKHIADLPQNPSHSVAAYKLNETVFLSKLVDRDRIITQNGPVSLRVDELVNHARLDFEGFSELQERGVANTMMLDLAKSYDLALTPEEWEQEKALFQEAFSLVGDEEIEAWRICNHLTESEFEQFIIDQGLIRKVKKVYAGQLSNSNLLRQLRMEGEYEWVAKTAMDKSAVLAEIYSPPDISKEELIRLYFEDKGREMPEDVNMYAAELGFSDYGAFILALEKSFRYRQYLAETARDDEI